MKTVKELKALDWAALAAEAEQVDSEAAWLMLFENVKEALVMQADKIFTLPKDIRSKISPLYKKLMASPFLVSKSVAFGNWINHEEVFDGLAINPMVPLWIEAGENQYILWTCTNIVTQQSYLDLGVELMHQEMEVHLIEKEVYRILLTHSWMSVDHVKKRVKTKNALQFFSGLNGIIRDTLSDIADGTRRTLLAHQLCSAIHRAFGKTPPTTPLSFLEENR